MATVPQELYDIVGNFEESDKSTLSSKIADYTTLLDAMKSPEAVVRAYVSQAVPEFAAYFPTEIARVVNQQIALCEDEDALVRNAALRGITRLPAAIPSSDSALLASVASAVIQLLLITEEAKERVALSHAFGLMVKSNFAECFQTVISLLVSPDFEEMHERLIAFTREHFLSAKDEMAKPENKNTAITQIKALLSRPDVSADVFRTFFIELNKLAPVTKETAVERVQEYCTMLYTFSGIAQGGNSTAVDFSKVVTAMRLAQRNIYSRSAFSPNFYELASIGTVVQFFMKNVLPAAAAIPAEEASKDLIAAVQTMAPVVGYLPPRSCPSIFNATLELFKNTVSASEEKAFTCAPEVVEVILFVLHHTGSYALDSVQHGTGLDMAIGQPFADSLDVVITKKSSFVNALKALSVYSKSSVEANEKKVIALQAEVKTLSGKSEKVKPVVDGEAVSPSPDVEKTEDSEEDSEAKKTKRMELNQLMRILKAQNKVFASILTLASLFLAEKPTCTRMGRVVLSFDGSAKNENKSAPPKDAKNAKSGNAAKGGNVAKSNVAGGNKRKAETEATRPSKRSNNNRDNRDNRDNGRNARDNRNARDGRDNRDNRNSRDSRDSRGGDQSRGGRRESSRDRRSTGSSSNRESNRDNGRNRR